MEKLRRLPAVHRVLAHPDLQAYARERELPRELVLSAAQETIAAARAAIEAEASGTEGDNDGGDGGGGAADDERLSVDAIAFDTIETLAAWFRPRLRRVVNGTGVVLHTNLGRALLDDDAVQRIAEAARYYSNVEYDVASGERGSRHSHVESLICRLTGAEAAMVVNNNAAAVYLVLRALSAGREVVVSRGQLVEIGGSFRVSETMRESGATLVEVGTTNKTHLRDYEEAIGERTAMLMKVHTSNFRVVGFTSAVSLRELAALGRSRDVLVYEDLGSGVLFDLRPYGIGDEPTVRDAIEAGADVVTFSGDKLLGGPQAGIVAGRKACIDRLKKHQAARMLRVDKLTLAALESTLRLYLTPERAKRAIPTLRQLLAPLDEIRARAESIVGRIDVGRGAACRLVDDESEPGGGTMPGVVLPTVAVELSLEGEPIHRLERLLRAGDPPIIVRVTKERIRIDCRTVSDDETELIANAVNAALRALNRID